MRKTTEMSGKWGRWMVLSQGTTRKRIVYWLCRCDCGTERPVSGDSLRNGRSQSCGCLAREMAAAQSKRLFTTHGHTVGYSTTSEYRSWYAMIRRCTRPGYVGFENYGGRGIKVCDRWHTNFPNFLADMGMKPSPKHTIERNDNDGNYEPGNCRWATRLEQAQNSRRWK